MSGGKVVPGPPSRKTRLDQALARDGSLTVEERRARDAALAWARAMAREMVLTADEDRAAREALAAAKRARAAARRETARARQQTPGMNGAKQCACGKVPYPGASEARKALRGYQTSQTRKKPRGVYQCRLDEGSWHLTSGATW